jgi:hypothetical protein
MDLRLGIKLSELIGANQLKVLCLHSYYNIAGKVGNLCAYIPTPQKSRICVLK